MREKKKQTNNVVKFPKSLNKLEKQIEAIIFAADEPLDIETVEKRVQSTNNIKKILLNLQSDYSSRGINLVCIKAKWSFITSKDLVNLMSLQKSTEKKLSKATLETLAIIVYHQPVTRSEIEEIRGVAFGTNTIEILLELDWVRPAGRKDVIGKPIQYATTDNFLHHFNIQRLTDLPNVDELSSAGLIDTATIDASIFGTGKFYKEQSQNKKEDIYSNIEKAIDETPNND
jgi:segregation and condensation protein B